jgi:hypothetical protein
MFKEMWNASSNSKDGVFLMTKAKSILFAFLSKHKGTVDIHMVNQYGDSSYAVGHAMGGTRVSVIAGIPDIIDFYKKSNFVEITFISNTDTSYFYLGCIQFEYALNILIKNEISKRSIHARRSQARQPSIGSLFHFNIQPDRKDNPSLAREKERKKWAFAPGGRRDAYDFDFIP